MPTTLARGPTARSAASPRLPPHNPSIHRRTASRPPLNPDAHQALAASLKQETDEKERLLVQLQDKEQLLNNYVTENGGLISALSDAESRLNEFYAEQSRWEQELAQRLDIIEKLREQVRETEREKRDLQRRYNEQTATFEAERQAFYDNEQHLKSRIQTLSQVARRRQDSFTFSSNEQEPEILDGDEEERPSTPHDDGPERVHHQDYNDPESEPAEMTALKLELSTLSTSYASLQSTLVLIQTQLVDLKRVNQELQEENESYLILLREKTLNGQFDVVKQVGGASISSEDDGSDDDRKSIGIDSMRSRTRSTLDIVEEEPFDGMDSEALGETSDSDISHHISRRPERRRASSSLAHRGESLAGLPITGPGLDLAAELGRAENKDILAGTSIDDGDRHAPVSKVKRSKKETLKLPQSGTNLENIEALRTEVKSLKDANKALSLYASKIIDRIIAQEGFEHILAVDYEKEPSTPLTAVPHTNNSKSLPFSQPAPKLKPRPQSTIFPKSFEIKSPLPPPMAGPTSKAQRRSLSFDWKSFSLFNTEKKPDSTPTLRPLTLKPGATSVTSARKLDNLEDEEDRKERERLHATMKLMGIQPTTPGHYPSIGVPMERASSVPNANAKNNRRFSMFNPNTLVNESDTSSLHSTSSSARYELSAVPSDLTQDALRLAEAEQSLAVLDARERDLRAEIAKGGSGGFTEIIPRSGRKSRRSGGDSSGSTVWSAGMSGNAED